MIACEFRQLRAGVLLSALAWLTPAFASGSPQGGSQIAAFSSGFAVELAVTAGGDAYVHCCGCSNPVWSPLGNAFIATGRAGTSSPVGIGVDYLAGGNATYRVMTANGDDYVFTVIHEISTGTWTYNGNVFGGGASPVRPDSWGRTKELYGGPSPSKKSNRSTTSRPLPGKMVQRELHRLEGQTRTQTMSLEAITR